MGGAGMTGRPRDGVGTPARGGHNGVDGGMDTTGWRTRGGPPGEPKPIPWRVTEFSLDLLRRRPDVEADNLFAVDAADRLLLDTAAAALAACAPGEVVTVGDNYGALALGAAAAGATRLRAHQDALSGQLALAANADQLGLGEPPFAALRCRLLAGAALCCCGSRPASTARGDRRRDRPARLPEVTVYATGMVKHIALAMNEVLAGTVRRGAPGLARQKARVIVATRSNSFTTAMPEWPQRDFHRPRPVGLRPRGRIRGTRVDIGTRFLLGLLDRAKPDATSAIDLGCGTGVLAAALAMARPHLRCSPPTSRPRWSHPPRRRRGERGRHRGGSRADGLAQPDASAELILLNPPFHVGAAVQPAGHCGCSRMPRVRPRRRLRTLLNSHLGYRPALTRIVGPTASGPQCEVHGDRLGSPPLTALRDWQHSPPS